MLIAQARASEPQADQDRLRMMRYPAANMITEPQEGR